MVNMETASVISITVLVFMIADITIILIIIITEIMISFVRTVITVIAYRNFLTKSDNKQSSNSSYLHGAHHIFNKNTSHNLAIATHPVHRVIGLIAGGAGQATRQGGAPPLCVLEGVRALEDQEGLLGVRGAHRLL